jgi:S1-C subfamily serine protease
VILYDGKTYPVTNVWIDPVLDIAVLALAVDESFATYVQEAEFIGRDESILVGQFAFAIGNALTQRQNTITFGVISAKNRELRMQGNNMYVGLLQTDTAINPGNS